MRPSPLAHRLAFGQPSDRSGRRQRRRAWRAIRYYGATATSAVGRDRAQLFSLPGFLLREYAQGVTVVGMSKIFSYFKFCSAVLKRAWQIAWAVVIERSIRAILRDLIILVIAVFSLYEMRGYLERIHALPEHDNLLAETSIWAALVAAATISIFAATFVFCAIFIAPFRLYQEQTEKLSVLSQAEQDKSERLPPQIEICSKSGAPYEVSDVRSGHVLSTIRIGIKNYGGSPLSNCKVSIEKMSPMPNLVGVADFVGKRRLYIAPR
jgi:hypothetical protein